LAVFSAAQGQTLCEKYADIATDGDQVALLQTIVGDVVDAALASNILKPFFDGTAAVGLIDFTDPANSAQLQLLVDNLVSYFGSSAVLACNDPAFPPYAGNPSMTAVHAKLPISYLAFVTFNGAVVAVADNLGVDDADLLVIAGVLANGITLEADGKTFYDEICNQKDCLNFCNKYSNILVLTNNDLLQAVVDGTVAAVVDPDSPILQYFDGSVTNSVDGTGAFIKTDFTTDAIELGLLVESLKSFFGDEKLGLGCTDGTLDPYTGEEDMKVVHEPMNSPDDDTLIIQAEFDFFNDALVGVLVDSGVNDDDAKTVQDFLAGFQDDICGGCVGDGGSSAGVLIPALFALLPLLAFFF
jgi:hypothetical protein